LGVRVATCITRSVAPPLSSSSMHWACGGSEECEPSSAMRNSASDSVWLCAMAGPLISLSAAANPEMRFTVASQVAKEP
jgi:hypothetical protein